MLVLGPQYMIYKVCHQGIHQNTAALKRYFLLLHFIFRAEATIRFDVKFSLARTVCSVQSSYSHPGQVLIKPSHWPLTVIQASDWFISGNSRGQLALILASILANYGNGSGKRQSSF